MQRPEEHKHRSHNAPVYGKHYHIGYKVLHDTGSKEKLVRYDGKVPGRPEFDVRVRPLDPRNRYRVKNLDMTTVNFTIDDFYCGIPPRREVSVFNLNDNVDTNFLSQMAKKIGEVEYLMVHYHPTSKKHLRMACIVFTCFADASRFVEQNNERAVMGDHIECILDPFLTKLDSRYSDCVGQYVPLPKHLTHISKKKLYQRREEIRRREAEERKKNNSFDEEEAGVSNNEMDIVGEDSPDYNQPPPEAMGGGGPVTPFGGSMSSGNPSRPESRMVNNLPLPAVGIITAPVLGAMPNVVLNFPPPPTPLVDNTLSVPDCQTGSGKALKRRRSSFEEDETPPKRREEDLSTSNERPYSRFSGKSYSCRSEGSSGLRRSGGRYSAGGRHRKQGRYGSGSGRALRDFSNDRYPRRRRSDNGYSGPSRGYEPPPPYSEADRYPRELPSTSRSYEKKKKRSRSRSSSRGRPRSRRSRSRKKSSSGSTEARYRTAIARSKRRSKKRKRSYSRSPSSSESSSSFGSGDYHLTVEKKEKSTKYTRDKEGQKIVEIKKVTKYKRTEAKSKQSGLQDISSSEEDDRSEKRAKSRKGDGHRWSSSSDSEDGRRRRKKEKSRGRDRKSRGDASRRIPGFEYSTPSRAPPPPPPEVPPMVLPPPGLVLGLPSAHHRAGSSMPPLPPMPMGFNPMIPPPPASLFMSPPPGTPHTPQHAATPSTSSSAIRPMLPIRFVESATPPPQQPQESLEDRLASIFGGARNEEAAEERTNPRPPPAAAAEPNVVRNDDELEDMDVEENSVSSPQPQPDDTERLEKERIQKLENLAKDISQLVLVTLRTDFKNTLQDDISRKILLDEFAGFEASWNLKGLEMEKLRVERAQAQMMEEEQAKQVAGPSALKTPEKETLSSPEKNAFRMPKISFLRKKPVTPPPPPKAASPTTTQSSDDSDGSSSSGEESDSSGSSSSSSSSSAASSQLRVKRRRLDIERPSSNESAESSSTANSSVSTAKSVQRKLSTASSASTSTAKSSSASTASSSLHVPLPHTSAAPQPPRRFRVPSATVSEEDLPPRQEILPREDYHYYYTEHCYPNLNKEAPQPTTIEQRDALVVENVKKILARYPNVEKRPQPLAVPPAKRKYNKLVKEEKVKKLPPPPSKLPPPLARKTTHFPRRTAAEEQKIVETWDGVFDAEDQEYLRQVWEELQPDGNDFEKSEGEFGRPVAVKAAPPWKIPVPFQFVHHEPTPKLLSKPKMIDGIKCFYDDDELEGVKPVPEGCARAMGYQKMGIKEKRQLIRRNDILIDKTTIDENDEILVRHQVQSTKEVRAMHRRLQASMGDLDLFKVNQLKFRKKMIKFARSRIHGWGLYAMESIAPDDMIIEYVGQKIRSVVADVREKSYEKRGIGSSYLFRIDEDIVIDATKMGNFARFINHSCQPNCYAKVVTMDGDKRIVIYSKCLINKGDEITYDYKFPLEEDKIDCLCNAPGCRGSLN